MNPSKRQCPQCRSANRHIVVDVCRGDVVCQACGLVLCARIARDCQEWRSVSDGRLIAGASRAGGALDPHRYSTQAALCSRVGGLSSLDRAGAKDGRPHSAAAAICGTGAFTSRDLVALHAYGQIDRLAALLHLNSRVLHLATALYRRARETPSARSRPLNAVCAAVVYVACRQLGVPRSLKEIAASPACVVDAREVGRAYCALARAQSGVFARGESMGTEIHAEPASMGLRGQPCLAPSTVSCTSPEAGGSTKGGTKSPLDRAAPSQPSGFIRRFCSNLALPTLIHVTAVEVSRRAQALMLLRTRSAGEVGAAVIYLLLVAMNTARAREHGNTAARRCAYLAFFERMSTGQQTSLRGNICDAPNGGAHTKDITMHTQQSQKPLPPVPSSAAGRAYENYLGNLTKQQRRPRRKLSRRDQRQLRALGCLDRAELCETVGRACSVPAATVRAGYGVLFRFRHVLLPVRFVKWWGVSLCNF